MITFASQLDFEKAVMDVLKERLNIHVSVNKAYGSDYYNPERERETKVKVTLNGEYVGEIDSDVDQG